MSEKILKLEKRSLSGKKLKDLRDAGKIPSVVYGRELKTPILTESNYNETAKGVEESGYHSTIDLDIAGKKQLAMIKNVAIDPVKRNILNIEFQAVSADQEVEAITPIVIINFENSEAAKTKKELSQVLESVEVKAKPSDLTSSIEIDASGLVDLEDKLTLADLKLPAGVEFAEVEIDMETAVAILYDPVAQAAAREAAEAAEAVAQADEADEKESENDKVSTPADDEAEK